MNDDRITDLEIRLAYQEEPIQSLNDVVSELNAEVATQQKQLTLLYQQFKLLAPGDGAAKAENPRDDIPPHY